MKSSNLHPDERGAGEEVIKRGKTVSYSPLYPLPTIIALSVLLDSMEARLFRKYVWQKLQKSAFMITPIFMISSTDNQ